jgi:hypothetical protein
MANATAHLLAAFHLLAALGTWPDSLPGSVSFELAFRNLYNSLYRARRLLRCRLDTPQDQCRYRLQDLADRLTPRRPGRSEGCGRWAASTLASEQVLDN